MIIDTNTLTHFALNGTPSVVLCFFFNLNRKLIGEAYDRGLLIFYIFLSICCPTLLFAQGNVRHIRSFFLLLFAYTLYWIAQRPWQIIHDDVIDMLWKFKVFGTAAWKFFLSYFALLLNFLFKFTLFLLPWGGWNTHLCYYNVMLCCLTSLPSLVLTYFIIYNIKRRRQFIYIFSVLLFYSFSPSGEKAFFMNTSCLLLSFSHCFYTLKWENDNNHKTWKLCRLEFLLWILSGVLWSRMTINQWFSNCVMWKLKLTLNFYV